MAALADRLPVFAVEATLGETQKASCFLAAAFACGEPASIAALMAEYAGKLTPAGLRIWQS